ncbi:GNAT family N-acetyltransferase [Dehalogenimonas sp. THU2]|uniref:GNAT family N-acetyltransferase n=1 Tax=Dehalogenimonas sp. THU2 TaxID=3151121 RepID=UPI003218DC5A
MNPKGPFMTTTVSIRRANPRDVPTIAEYNIALASETEDRRLQETTVTDGVRHFLEHSEFGFYIIAEIEGKPAAQTMITYEWSDWRNGVIWWIQSVYVSKAYRRRGLYRKLYEFVKTSAQNDGGVREIRLYVDRENVAAQHTYEALGMQRSHYLLYEAEV